MNWREPYRTMDATGSPEAAGSVAQEWISDLVERAFKHPDYAVLHVSTDAQSTALFRGTDLIAVATVFRDPMNFAVLVRWMDDYFERLIDDRQRCTCEPEIYQRVLAGGTCGMGGCPYGGDL